jgi:hypothetical protein
MNGKPAKAMGHFSQLDDDDAELLSGGVKHHDDHCNGSDYGHYHKSRGETHPKPGGKKGGKKRDD